MSDRNDYGTGILLTIITICVIAMAYVVIHIYLTMKVFL